MRLIVAALALVISSAGCAAETIEAQPDTYVGIGVELTMEAAGARVVRILPGSAALETGLAPGDVILDVDGNMTRGKSLADVVAHLRGEAGSEVDVFARTSDGNRHVTLERRALKNP